MRVLMTTMKLDIGGAETHIIELSKALKKRGIEITVASNGGAYEQELTDAGIPHVKIPFHSKNPVLMKKAYTLLKNLILKERFDVVHAHARIPAFLCSLLHNNYHFRFVTTAHWVFSTQFPYNLLTRWGQRSLAVSDDIKKYLIDNYKIPSDNIRVTINGINLDKFSADTDYSDIKEEFSLSDDKTRIVYVSRMDTDRSLAAHMLIEAAYDLDSKIENLEIIIVGGGNDYDKIAAEADNVNKKLNKRLILTTGSRTDINKFTASGDLFIGVSRAALEAMACEKPSIIAGNEGYIGIFDNDKLDISIDTNFCCRGCEPTTVEKLKSDIITVLTASADECKRLGKYARETVRKHYSMDTMADDAIKMYVSVIKNSKINKCSANELSSIDNYLVINPLREKTSHYDVMISGYYGFGNSGDDSILYAIIRELKLLKPDIKILTLSNTPDETSKVYGVDSISRFNIIKVFFKMQKTKLLISGGGSLIQDITSDKSLSYYLFIIGLAKFLNKKVMLYANGIGPIVNESNYKRINTVLNKTDLITLREPYSQEELKRFGVVNPPTHITADPAFNLFCADKSEIQDMLSDIGIDSDDKYFVISVRPWKTMSPDFINEIASVADYVSEKYRIKPLFIHMQPKKDQQISDKIISRMKNKAYTLLENPTPPQFLGFEQGAEFVLGMRLHTLIYAAKCNTPVIGMAYDPKVTSIMEYMGQSFRIPVENPDYNIICRYIDEIIENKADISQSLSIISDNYAKLAHKNAVLALGLCEFDS